MVWIDYAILSIIGLSMVISLVRGFIKEALSLASWLAAFFIARHYYADVAAFIDASGWVSDFQEPMIRNGIAVAILFISVLILGGLVNYIIGQLVVKTGLSGTDRLLGVCFGAVRGALLVSAMLLFMDTFTSFGDTDWWRDSTLIPEFGIVIEWFFEYAQSSSSFLGKPGL